MKEKHRDKSKSKLRKSLTSSKKRDPLLNEIFFEKYKTVKKLGEGSFGKVYKAEYNGEYYALKFESRARAKSLLEMEGRIISYLQGPNIPFIKTYGYSGEYNLLIMQLMDRSLEDILRIRKTFSIKTTAMLGFQLIGVLHFIHDKSIIHRDVKPDNCVMGYGELNENLYLIDFGLAKKYRSFRTLKQYPLTKKKRLTGTARYASINALEGYEQSRRDDMESVGYIMAYLLRGGLPWQGLKLKSKENKYKNILEKKKSIPSKELFKGFPNEFAEILDYTKKLEYTEEPEYEMLRNKLMAVCKRLNYNFDFIYDWTTERDLEKRKNKKNSTAPKTQSTLSARNKKGSKTKKKEKFEEKFPNEIIEKHKKNKDKSKNKENKKENDKEKEENKANSEKENDNKKENENSNSQNNEKDINENNHNEEINEDEHENDEESNEKKSAEKKEGKEGIEGKEDKENKEDKESQKSEKKEDSNNKEDIKEENDEDNKINKEEKEDKKSNKTYSFEHKGDSNNDNNNNNDNNSNGAEIDEEEGEVQEFTCCKM